MSSTRVLVGRLARRRAIAVALAAGLAASAALNLAQFSSIDEETRHNYKAIERYESPNLFDVAIARDNSARERVAPFLYFGKLFPGADVIAPLGGVDMWFDFETGIIGLGGAGSLRWANYEASTFVDLREIEEFRVDASNFVTSRGSTQAVFDERVSYFAPDRPSGEMLVVLPDGQPGRHGKIAFVDTVLLEVEQRHALLGAR